MKEQVRSLLASGQIDVCLAYKLTDGHPLPHAFTGENLGELDALLPGSARYPLEKIAAKLAAGHPDLKIGIIARDCSQRALKVLSVWNQPGAQSIEIVNVNCCPSDLKDHADCSYLSPRPSGRFKRQVGIDNGATLREAEAFGGPERFNRWMYEFQKCIKCYGCRDICPVCFCAECTLEHEDLIGTGRLPPAVPIFHLVRAVHMAGRCVDCGLCEEACPAEIPLRLLYRKVNEIVADLFDYRAGVSSGPAPFQELGETATLKTRPMEAA
jgi:formate dehydrogenase subunit beta